MGSIGLSGGRSAHQFLRSKTILLSLFVSLAFPNVTTIKDGEGETGEGRRRGRRKEREKGNGWPLTGNGVIIGFLFDLLSRQFRVSLSQSTHMRWKRILIFALKSSLIRKRCIHVNLKT